MIHMVIAEDEVRTRNGLGELAWAEIGIQAHLASNGLEALKLVQRYRSKILFTDIRMPGIDGLELIEHAKEIQPDICSIIFTGYRDFDYAKRAIELKASDYVMKPSNPEEILATVKKNILSIYDQQTLLACYKEYRKMHLEHPLAAALRGAVCGKAEAKKTIQKALALCNESYVIAAFMHKQPGSEHVYKVLSEQDDVISWLVCDDEEILLVMICGNHVQTIDRIKKIQRALGDDVRVGISQLRDSVDQLTLSRDEAIHCAGLFFAHQELQYIQAGAMTQEINQDMESYVYMANCIEMVKQRNYQGMEESLDLFKKYIETKACIEEKYIKYQYMDLCVSALRIFEGQSKALPHHLSLEDYSRISAARCMDELNHFTKRFMNNLLALINDRKNAINPLVKDVCDIVGSEYMNDLRLNDIARRIHVNADYISRVLKRELGKSYIQYLTQVRLAESCRLLVESDMEMTMIAESVGILDARYYSQLFRRKYHMTPNQYRKQHRR